MAATAIPTAALSQRDGRTTSTIAIIATTMAAAPPMWGHVSSAGADIDLEDRRRHLA